jgi:hypothetical protein
MKIEIDLDEFFEDIFPPRRSLIGLQFANEEDFERAKVVAHKDFDLYQETYPVWKMIVVRREDAARFAEAGLHWQEIEQIDDDDLTPEEVRRRDRALIDSVKDIALARAREYK